MGQAHACFEVGIAAAAVFALSRRMTRGAIRPAGIREGGEADEEREG